MYCLLEKNLSPMVTKAKGRHTVRKAVENHWSCWPVKFLRLPLQLLLRDIWWIGRSSIDFLAMANSHYNHHQLLAFNLIDDPIISYTDSIISLSRMKFLGSEREGILGQSLDVPPESLLDYPV
jgi:hypothetical protein